MKKYHSGEKLQNRELNLVLRNTERGAISNEVVFAKYYPDFKLSPGIHCQGNSSRITAIFFLSERFSSQLCFLQSQAR